MTVVREIPMTVVPDVPHGTVSGYNYHRCRCDECRQAKRERSRQTEENTRHPCEVCGVLCSRRARVCRPCWKAASNAARDERRREIQRRWFAGESLRQIGAALDSTPETIQVELVRMRQAGWNVPQRGPGGKILA